MTLLVFSEGERANVGLWMVPDILDAHGPTVFIDYVPNSGLTCDVILKYPC
jgi:hypothetical protein